ncbi:MAG: hypothetical protein ABSG64_05725 [Solirubrobacteraceae bacterium]|jgi:hypothetical protein
MAVVGVFWIPLLVIIVVVAVHFVGPILFPSTTGPFGSQAGYAAVSAGRVRSVAATWRVPRVLGGARDAQAGTWVGVQAGWEADVPAGWQPAVQLPGDAVPFVQVGTIEQGVGFHDRDHAFWSDADHSFSPVFLGPVSAGDLVSARLVETQIGWAVTVDDITTRTSRTAMSYQGVGSRYDVGLWLQEDPMEVTSVSDLSRFSRMPYPQLSPVRFQRLLVNGKPPAYANVYSQWLSLPGERNLAPTPLVGDQFGFHVARISSPGNQFLNDDNAARAAYSNLLIEVQNWTALTSRRTVAAQVAPVVSAYRAYEQAISTQHWPLAVRAEIPAYLASLAASISELRRVAHYSPSQRSAWAAGLYQAIPADRNAGAQIKRLLGLPQLRPW